MRTTDIINTITSKGLNVRYSWSKDYGNGTSLFEHKIYKSSRHRKPLAYVQIGFYNTTKEVIGFTITYADRPSECVDCENLSDLENALAQILQYHLTETNRNNLDVEKTISNIKDLQKLAMSMTKDEFLSFIMEENDKNGFDVRENDDTIDFEYLNLTATINKSNNKLSRAFDVWDNEGNWVDTFYDEETPFKEDVEYCKIISLIEEIADVNDKMRDLFLELSNIIAFREFNGKQTIIDDNFNIKSEDISKFKESLEEIRKFALFV